MEASRSSETGRFERRGVRDALTLYAILRAVAEAAVTDRPTADPRKVTVRQWRDARHLCEPEFGHIPLPQEIRRQLAKLNGDLLPFGELLAIAFNERGNIERVHMQLQAEDRSEGWMSDRHIWYALRYVARSLAAEGQPVEEMTIEPQPYELERRRLIAADNRRWKNGGHLAGLLPSFRQIDTYAGSWDRALQIAGLAPRRHAVSVIRTKKSISIPEAIVRYYEVVGVLPTAKKLLRFRRDYGFAVEGRKSQRFGPFIAQALELIAERGLPTPPPYEETKNLRVTWPIPEKQLDPDTPSYIRGYTEPQIIGWVIEYLATPGAGRTANQFDWSAFAATRPECPSSAVITAHGGLAALVAKARHPRALERAEGEHRAQVAAEAARKIEADAAKPQAVAVLTAMEELGGTFLGLAEIAAHLRWKGATLGNWLDVLRTAGKVELADASVGSKAARYSLAECKLTPAELRTQRNLSFARGPSVRRVLAFLADADEPAHTKEIGELLGRSRRSVWRFVEKLVSVGYVEAIRPAGPRKGAPQQIGYRLSEAGRAVAAQLAAEIPTEHS